MRTGPAARASPPREPNGTLWFGAAVLATCHRPRRRGRGVESDDAVIAGLLLVSALLWGDVAAAAAGDGVLATVRRDKTNPEARDVRFVKGDVAGAHRTLRAAATSETRVVASRRHRRRQSDSTFAADSSSPAGRGVSWFGGVPPERASRPTSIAAA